MKRETHLWHIVAELGGISFDEVLTKVKNYRNWLLRLCERKGYACLCFIGLFWNSADKGSIQIERNGKKVFVSHSGQKIPAAPEIHIVLLANPGQELAKKTRRYFIDYGIGYPRQRDNQAGYVLSYVMEHSLKCRTVACNTDKLPARDLSEFIKVAECMNVTMGGYEPVFENLSEDCFVWSKNILENADVDLVTKKFCSGTEKILKNLEIARLFNVDFTSNALQYM